MRTWPCLLIGFTLVSVLQAADEPGSPPDGWKQFSPKDRSFSVWLPDKGKQNERDATIVMRGSILKVRMARVEQKDGSTFSAGVLILPLQLRRTPAGELIEVVRDGAVKESKAKRTDEKDVKLGKASGKEYWLQTGQGVTRLRVFAIAGRIHRVELSGTKEKAESAEADTFMDSYKLRAVAAADPSAEPKPENPDPNPKPAPKPVPGGLGEKVTQANFDMVKVGMSEAEVKALLGEPTKITPLGAINVWNWQDSKTVVTIHIKGGKVSLKQGVGLK